MNAAVELYNKELQHRLDKLCGAIDGLDVELLNWRPTIPEANSVSAISTHVLGNVRAWVLGVCCGQPVERDRAAEFKVEGLEAGELIERTKVVGREAEEALMALDASTLDELREVPDRLTSQRSREPVTGREAAVHAIAHAAEHLGHIEITRDLARTAVGPT